MTIEEKAKAYDEALERAKEWYDNPNSSSIGKGYIYAIFPELKESEDERMIKRITLLVNGLTNEHFIRCGASLDEIKAWLEKQGEQKASYTTIAETGNGGINALVTGELSNSCDYEEKPADKVEPKFRVKYAGSEYNVLEIKEIAGDTYYGIEDEPNHIDYVLPDNCEIVSEQKSWSEEDETSIAINNPDAYKIGFADGEAHAKEEMTTAWSEEDEQMLNHIICDIESLKEQVYCTTLCDEEIAWLKSLKQRIGG